MASKARSQVAWLPQALRGRATLLSCTALGTVASLLLATPARAQLAANARPSGGVVSAGSAAISTSASTTTITQSSARTAINWQSFNVGSQQTVDFIQPSSSSVALNRVISSNPSQIAGRIDANGQIILINQSGVIVDQGSQVNTAGLIVSAAGMSNVNFMAGKLVFDQAANPNAAVVNQGSLTVKQAGLAALVAPQVANSGVITATLGHVVLAGAKTATLDLYGDGLVSLDVNNALTQAPAGPGGAPVAALVTNTGVIRADGGTVQLTAREADGLVQNLVQAGGTISANSVTSANGTGSKTGSVVLGGLGGSIVLSGVVTADGSAPGTTGGQVQATASQGVTLAAGARVSASGPAGGGTVAIGTTLARATGGPGTASALTAQTVTVAPGATIAADATGKGDGGRVTVLSSLSTSMAGAITARGGPQGGNGGFVETSGASLSIGPSAIVDASALSATGSPGTWLLDPLTLDVVNGNKDQAVTTTKGSTITVTPSGAGAQISNNTIDGELNKGTNVVLTTEGTGTSGTGDITVDKNAGITWTTTATLTMNSAGAISILAPISGTTGTLVLDATGGTVTQTTPGTISVANLSVTASGAVNLSLGNTVTTLAGSVTGAGNSFDFVNTAAPLTVGVAGGVTGITTNAGSVGLATTTSGAITISSPMSSGGAEIDIAAAPGSGVTNTAAIKSGGSNIVILGDTMSLSGGTLNAGTTGMVVLGPATTTDAVALGAASEAGVLGLAQADLSSVTAGMLQIGYRDESGKASLDGNINLATALTLSTSDIQALALVTGGAAGTVTQTAGATLTFAGGTLGVIAGGDVALGLTNSVGAVAGLSDGGAGNFTYINGAALSVGALPAQQLGVAMSGTTGLASSAGFAVPINSSGALAGVTVVGGATTGSIILETTGAGDLTLNQPVNANSGLSILGATPGQVGLQAFGNITQASAGVITAGGLEALAGGSVTLDVAVNQIGNATRAAKPGLLAGSATTGTFALRDDAHVLQVDTFAVTTGAATLATATGVTTTNNDIDLKSAGLILNQPLAAGTGAVRLVESGAVSQAAAGAITAGSLSVTDSGGQVVLESANAVGTAAVDMTFAGGAFSFNDAATALTVGSVAAASAASDPSSQFGVVTGATTSNGDINLQSGGLALNQAVGAGTGTVRLVETGAVSQAAGAITAGSLAVTDTGGQVVLDATNAVGTVAANVTFATGALTLNNGTTGLVDGSVGAAAAGADPSALFTAAVTGVATSNGDINLASGGLALHQVVTAGTGTVRLVASGTVLQAAAGVITAGSLSVTDSGGRVVLETANAVGTLAASVTSAGGAVTFNANTAALTVGSVAAGSAGEDPSSVFGAVSGVTTRNADINLQSGGLALTDAVAAGTGTVRLVETGAVSQAAAGAISAGALSVSDSGGQVVLEAANAVGTLAANVTFAGGVLTLTNGATALTVGSVGAAAAGADPSALFATPVSGLTTSNADINLASAGLALNQAVGAGTGTVRLVESGAVSQAAAGAITAASLAVTDSGGQVVLEAANAVGTVAGDVTFTGGAFSFNDPATALSISSIASAPGGPGSEDPSGLFGAVVGVATNNGDINLAAAGLLLEEGLGAGIASVRLVDNGSLAQTVSGVITAGSLAVSVTNGSVALGAASAIGTVAANVTFAGGTFSLDDGTTALTVGSVAAAPAGEDPSALFAAVTGVTTKAGNITLQGAGITLNQAVSAGLANVTLTSTGAISQGAAGAITAVDLAAVTELDAGGSIALTSSGNAVQQATLISLNTAGAAFSTGAIGFVDGIALTIANLGGLQIGVVTLGAVQLADAGASLTIPTGAAVIGTSVEIGLSGATGLFTNHGVVGTTISGTVPTGDVVILANQMSLAGGTISAPDAVVLGPFSRGVGITVDGTAAGTLSLQQADLASISTGLLQIGYPTLGGDIAIAGALSLTTVPALALVTGGSISETGGGTVTYTGAGSLALVAGGPVSMPDANQVSTLAGSTTGAGQTFSFGNTNLTLTVGAFPVPLLAVAPDGNNFPVPSTGVTPSGITTANGNITLATATAGNLVLDAPVNAGTGTVELDSVGLINASLGAITAGVLTDTVTAGGAATFTDAANAVTTLGPFAAAGQLSLTDTVTTLTVAGAVSGAGVTLSNSGAITFASGSTLSAGVGGTAELDAAGGAIDAHLGAITAGVLTDTVPTGGAATFTDAANAVGTLGPFTASGNIALNDTVALTIGGVVASTAGNVYLQTSAGGGITFGGFGVASVSGGTIGLQTDALTNLGTPFATGNANAGPTGTFELAPNTVGTAMTLGAPSALSLTNLNGITAGTVRIGAVTPPSGGAPTITAGPITILGNFGASGVNLELDSSSGSISELGTAALTAGTLTGSAQGAVLLVAPNVVTTLGPFTTTGQLSLIDEAPTPLTIQGAVSGSGVTLSNISGIVFAGGSSLSAGVGGTVELDAAGGAIDASRGAITAGVLTDTVTTGGAATFTDAANVVTTLGPFAAGGELSLIDTVATLNVAGAVSGSGVTLNNPGGITFGAGSTLSAGVGGTVELDAATGAINAAQGAITAGLLTEAVPTGGAATFTDAANAVGTLGPYAAVGELSLTDDVATLTVAGAVSGVGVKLSNTGGITFAAASTLSAGPGGTAELDAGGAINASLGAITAGVLTDTVTTGGAALFTDAANAVGTLGPFAAAGQLSLTDTVTTLNVAGAVSGSGVTLNTPGGITFGTGSTMSAGPTGTVELDAAGGPINAAQGAITAGVLTDTVTTAGAATFTNAANAVGTLGPFAATGQVSLTDTVTTLNVAGAVSGSGVTLNNPGGITFVPGSTLSVGAGTVELDASGGPINAAQGAITAGVLTDTVTTGGAALFTDAANVVTTLGPFAATGQLSLTDTVPTLTLAGAVSGSGVMLSNTGGITFAAGSTLSAGAGGTVELDAAGGAIDAAQGAITTGVLTDTTPLIGAALFTNPANMVTTLGPFAATGQLSLTDAVPTLTIAGAVSASGVTLSNTGGIAFAAGSTLSAGGAGTVTLNAKGGAIHASLGAITAGVLTDTVTTGGAATFTDAANAVGTLGPFAATGQLSLTDTVPTLTVAGAVSGSGVTLNNPGGITFAAASTLSAGVGGTVELDASGGPIDASRAPITAGVLTDTVPTGGAATFTDAANAVGTLGPFAAGGELLLTDTAPTLNVAGAVSGTGVTLNNPGGITFAPGSTLSAGVGGTVELDAMNGPINAAQGAITAGLLTQAVATGGAATFTDAANTVGTLGPYAASGQLSLADNVATLTVAGAVVGSGVTLSNTGGITFAAASTLTARAGGTAELDAGGAIDASLGAITAGVLTDTVTTGGSALFTDAANVVTTLGPFAAAGQLSLTDTVTTLNVAGAVSGAGVKLSNTGGISFGGGSTLSAGSGGTVELDAAGGPINASTGAITAAVLTDTVTTGGFAVFTDAANVVTTLGPFAASGQVTLVDTVPTLDVAGAVSGSGVRLVNPGGIVFAGGSTLSAGAGGTVELDASGGPIDASLAPITAGVLTATVTTGGAATFTDAANAVGTLGPFAASGELSLTDNVPTLTLAGAVSGGGVTPATSGVTLNNTGGISFAALSTLSAGATGTLTLNAAGGPINAAQGALTASVLTDTVPTGGAATFTDLANAVATLGPFASTGTLSLTDHTALTLTGIISAPLIVINTQANPLTMASGATLVTGGTAPPNPLTLAPGQIPTNPPAANGVGAYFTSSSFTQLGTSAVTPIAGSANTILFISVVNGGNVTFGSVGGLNAPGTWLILGLDAAGSKVSGTVAVKALTVQLPVNSVPSDFSVTLSGSVNGLEGQAAAGAGGVIPTKGATIQFNNCPIGTVGCVLLSGVPVPAGNPLQFLTLGILVAPPDEGDLLLPLVSDEDYLSCLLRKDCN